MKPHDLYIGLMSGTSLDAVDAALIDFSNGAPKIITTYQHEIPSKLRQDILDLFYPGDNAIYRMGKTDVKLGHLFADSVHALLEKTDYTASDIQAVGSHGQNIRHAPNGDYPFTIQIGDPNIIAAKTGITTVADFRRRDMALGGQAAPLAPAFHNHLFQNRTMPIGVLNIGGIANLTYLPSGDALIIGFDTGPGNTLMDLWYRKHHPDYYDKNGAWAASGQCNEHLLKRLLEDSYFLKSPPKSTGREYFNLGWLEKNGAGSKTAEAAHDVQATLLELTACSIADSVNALSPQMSILYVCGGGAHNAALMRRLNALCKPKVENIAHIGIHPDWVEAAAFAWLAQQTLQGKPGNVPSVTGARTASVLGAIYTK